MAVAVCVCEQECELTNITQKKEMKCRMIIQSSELQKKSQKYKWKNAQNNHIINTSTRENDSFSFAHSFIPGERDISKNVKRKEKERVL